MLMQVEKGLVPFGVCTAGDPPASLRREALRAGKPLLYRSIQNHKGKRGDHARSFTGSPREAFGRGRAPHRFGGAEARSIRAGKLRQSIWRAHRIRDDCPFPLPDGGEAIGA